jgi:broad specificity phosphatase PhoE
MAGAPGPAELILVRHAPTAWSGHRYCGRSDPSLDGPGLAAAATLASELAPTLPAGIRIVSSPRRRALETATAIANAAGLVAVIVDDRWREADFGIAEGRTFDELATIEPALAARLATGVTEIDWPGGESAAAFEARVHAAWRDLLESRDATVLVSHAGPLRLAIAAAGDMSVAGVTMLEPAAFVRLDHPAAAGSP